MKFIFFFLIFFTIQLNAQEIEVKNLQKHIYFLADDQMKWLGTGSKQNAKASKYIAKEFKKLDLQPLGSD